jgi:hypothetical protein
MDIFAVHSVNAPGQLESWVGLTPGANWEQACPTFPSRAFLHTAEVSDQITVFGSPIHANAEDFVFIGTHVANTTNQMLSGEASIFLLPAVPPSMVPCALHGAFAGMDGTWELDPAQEQTTCSRLTLIDAHLAFLVRIENGLDGMESVLSVGDPTGPDGVGPCNETADATTRLAIVKGNAIVEAKPRDLHLLVGQQLVLRVHAANTTNVRRTGTVSASLY